MGALSPTHWLIIAGIVVLLFGAKKLPDTARSMGQSMRILKAETRELRHDDHHDTPAGPNRGRQPGPLLGDVASGAERPAGDFPPTSG
jgi:sec-independent protein translocase protein TatA